MIRLLFSPGDFPKAPSPFCWGFTDPWFVKNAPKAHRRCTVEGNPYGLFWWKGVRYICSCPCHPWNAGEITEKVVEEVN